MYNREGLGTRPFRFPSALIKPETGRSGPTFILSQSKEGPFKFLESPPTSDGRGDLFVMTSKVEFFLNVYLFLRERERQSVSRGGAEREGDTESEAGSRLPAVSPEPSMRLELTDHEIMT